ncbi:MAG: hypothetical protein ACR2QB_04850 [Gammaproteobacteria bacterium]
MSPGWQELIALTLVVVVVGFALYRRWRKPAQAKSSCCSEKDDSDEKTVHFYRRNSP